MTTESSEDSVVAVEINNLGIRTSTFKALK